MHGDISDGDDLELLYAWLGQQDVDYVSLIENHSLGEWDFELRDGEVHLGHKAFDALIESCESVSGFTGPPVSMN